MKMNRSVSALFLLLLNSLSFASLASGQEEIFTEDFERGDLSAWSSFAPADESPPSLALVSPDGTATDNLTPLIELSFADSQSGLDLDSLTVSLDEIDLTPVCDISPTAASCRSPLIAAGNHVVNVSLADRAGNPRQESFTFSVALTGGPLRVVLEADADTSLDAQNPNSPRGSEEDLLCRAGSPTLLRFGDALASAMAGSNVLTAQLILTVEANEGGWNARDAIEVYRLNAPFSEPATTWSCAEDTNPEDGDQDCAAPWSGGDYEDQPFTDSPIDASTTGEVSFDVTSEAARLLDDSIESHGLVILPRPGSQGEARWRSREAMSGRPRLELLLGQEVDESAPELTFLEPLDNQVLINNSAPEIRIALADADSGIVPASFRLTSGIADLSGSCVVTSDLAICQAPILGQGVNNLRAEVFDQGGNRGFAEISITVVLDDQPPTLRLLSPTGSEVIAPAPPDLEIAFSDTDSGIDLSSFEAFVDDAPLAGCSVRPEGATCPLTSLAEGPHSVSARVSDQVGLSRETRVDFELSLDPIPPVLALVRPLAPVVLSEPPVPVEVSWSDDDSGVDPVSLRLSQGGIELADDCTVELTGALCELGLTDGANDLTFRVFDRAGNVVELPVSVDVLYDVEAPTLDVLAPAEGELIEVASPTVEVSFADALSGLPDSPLRLLVNGRDVTSSCSLTPGAATCTLPALEQGGHALLAEVLDLAGNSITRSVNFELQLVDTEAPKVRFTSPAPGLSQGFGAPAIEMVWSDPSGLDLPSASILVDGEEITAGCNILADGASCPARTLAAGQHTVFAQIRDSAGNLGTASVAFELELELTVKLEEPVAGALTRDQEITVAGTASDLAETVEINGVEAVVSSGTFTATGVPLAEGANSLAAVARNSLGAVGTDTRVVVSDTQPPWLVITMPPDGFITTEPQMIVTGEVANPTSSANDVAAPTVTVNAQPATVEQRSFALTNFLLQPGENVIRVEATDQVGNVGVRETRVTYVPDAEQKIVEMLGNDQRGRVKGRLPKPLIVRVVDFLDRPLNGRTVRFEVSRGDGVLDSPPLAGRALEVTTDDRGFAQTFLTLGQRSGAGNHEVTATSPGIPGQVIFCTSAEPGPPARIVRIVGDNHQGALTAIAGAQVPNPLYVQVFDALGNPAPEVPVTFTVEKGDGDLSGSPFTVAVTDAEGKASTTYRLGSEPGVNNHVVSADFPKLTEDPALFFFSAKVPGPEAETRVSGVVLDNQDRPVPGATLHIRDTELAAISDASGRFAISGAPVGSLFLEVDGTTVTLPGTWPHLEFKLSAIAGQDNTLGKPIRLLSLDTEGGAMVGGAEDVTLQLAGVPGAELTVFANSARFPDGSSEAFLTFTQVHADKVPMEAPMGSGFMLAWSVQPTGTLFDPPAQIKIPNADLSPGAVVDIFSFDHDLAEFIPIGTASVTEDGSQLVSNPGFGMVKAGWHGCVPPPPPEGDACKESACTTCGPGGPSGKCGGCETCNGGGCTPKEVNEVTALANGEDGEDGEVVGGTANDLDFSTEVDAICDSLKYRWDFGDGNQADIATPSHRYEEPGTYTVMVEVMCEGCGAAVERDSIEVKIIEVDLIVDELPEEDEPSPHEENPGQLLLVNDDDDDDDDTPDFEQMNTVDGEDDLVEAMIDLGDDPPADGMLRLEALSGGDKIRVFEEKTKGTEIELPKTWDLATETAPEMVFIEGVLSSDEEQDVELTLSFENENTPEPIEDVAILTVADLEFTVTPGEQLAVDADDRQFFLVAGVFIKKFGGDDDEIEPVEDGASVDFELLSGPGSLDASSVGTEFGLAAVGVNTSTSPGSSYRGKGTLTSFRLKDSIFEDEIEVERSEETETTQVIVGLPASIELLSSTSQVAADGTATAQLTAIVRDAAGNTVANGTPVSWLVRESDSPFDQVTSQTNGGVATATLRAPLSARDQRVEVRAGNVVKAVAIQVVRVTGNLTSSLFGHDISTGAASTMTAVVNAADGTGVSWFASNGSILGGSSVSGGIATATLSTVGGRPGPVVVLATIGDRLLVWSGTFFASGKVAMSPQDPFLVAGATENRVIERIGASGQVSRTPVISSTTVQVTGPPGAAVVLDAGGATALEAYNFEAANGGSAPGILAGRSMALNGPTVDTEVAQSGAQSLRFEAGDQGTIADDPLFSADGGLGVGLWVRPAQIQDATLIEKGSAWSLAMTANGTVRGRVDSSSGSFELRSDLALEADQWHFVRLEAVTGVLRLTVDNETKQRSFSGTVDRITDPIVVGGESALFEGHIDDLGWFRPAETPTLGTFVGVGAGGLLQLDASGEASFTIENTGGELEPFEIVPLVIRARVVGGTVAELSTSGALGRDAAMNSGECDGTAVLYVAEPSGWAIAGDAVGSFFGADPEGTAGVVANVAGGVLIVGDVGAIVKNLWRMAGFSDTEPNYAELTLSGLGILTEIALGAGEILDVPISAAKAIVARIGDSPLADIIVRRLKRWIDEGVEMSQREVDLLAAMAESPALESFARAVSSDDDWVRAAKVFEQVGDDAILQIARVADDIGPAIAQQVTKILGEVSDDVLLSLKNSGRFDQAVTGMAKVLDNGIADGLLTKALNNGAQTLGTTYRHDHLLIDLGKVADVDGLKGLVESLGRNNPSGAKGFRYELEVAVHFKGQGQSVQAIGREAPIPGAGGANTDIDVLANGVAYQAKISSGAFKKPAAVGLKKAQNWVGAALKTVGGDPAKVKYAVPAGVRAPARVRRFFETFDPPIEVLEIALTP